MTARDDKLEQDLVDVIRRIGVKAGVAPEVYGAMCHELRTILRCTPSAVEQSTVIWGPERQEYPGGPVYRVGSSTGATLPEQPSIPSHVGDTAAMREVLEQVVSYRMGCRCSLREIDSGHHIDCHVPEFQALQGWASTSLEKARSATRRIDGVDWCVLRDGCYQPGRCLEEKRCCHNSTESRTKETR